MPRTVERTSHWDCNSWGSVLWDCQACTFIPTYSALGLRTPVRPVGATQVPFSATWISPTPLPHQVLADGAATFILSQLP